MMVRQDIPVAQHLKDERDGCEFTEVPSTPVMQGMEVETVETPHLGVHLDNRLEWAGNTMTSTKKHRAGSTS